MWSGAKLQAIKTGGGNDLSGVAMDNRGTAVARESADLVLLGDSFSSLVQAIALGRRIEANLRRALGYTLAVHLPIAAVSLLPLLLRPLPELTLWVLWIAVVIVLELLNSRSCAADRQGLGPGFQVSGISPD